MSLDDRIRESMALYLIDMGYDITEVTSYDESTVNSGYCETCSYEEIVVTMYYTKVDGNRGYYTYYGSFAELLRSLS